MKTLILGGTTEASMLARMLVRDARFPATLSLAGVTDAPVRPPGKMRIGGFGGATGLAAYMSMEGIEALVDATHPFAARISASAEVAATMTAVPRLVVCRPAWQQRPGDRWTLVADMAEAAEALGPKARRVLLTVGRKELAEFVARPAHRYVVRSIDPPGDSAPAHAEIITARGPFEIDDELDMLRSRRIEVVVTKNSGGSATYAKLAAANQLGLPVVMVDRPPPPRGQTVADAASAALWLERICHAALVPRGV